MDREKYIAMDVHQASISVAVRDAAGKLIVESIIETKAATILAFIRGIHLVTGAGNRPASIEGFETIHHSSEIFVHGEIAAAEFPQGAHPILSVVHRREKSGAQQMTQLPCIDSIILVARIQQSVLPRIAYDHFGDVRF